MKKETPLKMVWGSKMTSNEKRGTQKNAMGLKKTSDEKEAYPPMTRQSRAGVTPFLYSD
jgi:hypothetical protein